jgi:hypothetical protein
MGSLPGGAFMTTAKGPGLGPEVGAAEHLREYAATKGRRGCVCGEGHRPRTQWSRRPPGDGWPDTDPVPAGEDDRLLQGSG